MTAARAKTTGLAELYALHAPKAGRLAYLLTGDRELAEDLVQDAFVRVAGRFGGLRSPEAFEAYLRQTVVNLSRGHWRRKSTERRYLSSHGRGRRSCPPSFPMSRATGRSSRRWRG